MKFSCSKCGFQRWCCVVLRHWDSFPCSGIVLVFCNFHAGPWFCRVATKRNTQFLVLLPKQHESQIQLLCQSKGHLNMLLSWEWSWSKFQVKSKFTRMTNSSKNLLFFFTFVNNFSIRLFVKSYLLVVLSNVENTVVTTTMFDQKQVRRKQGWQVNHRAVAGGLNLVSSCVCTQHIQMSTLFHVLCTLCPNKE